MRTWLVYHGVPLVALLVVGFGASCLPHETRLQTRSTKLNDSGIDLWTSPDVGERWLQNIDTLGGIVGQKHRWIVTAAITWTAGDGEERTNLPAALELLEVLQTRNFRTVAAIAHPRIEVYDDWFKRSTFDEVLGGLAQMHGLASEKLLVGLDIEPYKLQGKRYPQVSRSATEGWKLADATQNLSAWLRARRIAVLIQQAHPTHLLPHTLREAGVEVIWADSGLKEAVYGNKPGWAEQAPLDTEIIHAHGGLRWATLTIGDWMNPKVVAVAQSVSDGRFNIFMNNTKDRACDPWAKWRYPLQGWSDAIRDCENTKD